MQIVTKNHVYVPARQMGNSEYERMVEQMGNYASDSSAGVAKLQALVAKSVEAEKRKKKQEEKDARLHQLRLKNSDAQPVTSKKGQKRNTPCACGSGKKFKKCCLKKGGAE